MSGPFHPASDKLYWWDDSGSGTELSAGGSSFRNNHNSDLNPDEQEILGRPLLNKGGATGGEQGHRRSHDYDSDIVSHDSLHGSELGGDAADNNNEIETYHETLRTFVVGILAVAGVTTSVAAVGVLFLATGGASAVPLLLLGTAGGLTTAISPFMVQAERALAKRDSTRMAINKIRDEIGKLKHENDKLANSNTELEGQVEELKTFETKLDGIVSKSGQSVHHFVKLVKEFGEILAAKQSVVKTIVLQDLIGLMIKQDTNHNFEMDEEEMESLFFALGTYGVRIPDEAEFKRRALRNPSIDAILLQVKDILDGQNLDENNVLDVQENHEKTRHARSIKLSL